MAATYGTRSAKACGISAEAWVRARLGITDAKSNLRENKDKRADGRRRFDHVDEGGNVVASLIVCPSEVSAMSMMRKRIKPDISEAVKKAFEDIP